MSSTARNQASAAWRVSTARPPYPGESADGLLARVAAAEFATRTLDFTTMAGAAFTHRATLSRQDLNGIHVVADCLRVDPNDLVERCTVKSAVPRRSRRSAFFGLSIDAFHVVPTVRRFAPASLNISEHHRALWMLRPFPFCEETWQLLVENCPNPHCGITQRWQRTNGIGLCDSCGEPLVRADSDPVPEALRERLGQAIGLVHPDADRRRQSLDVLPAEIAGLGSSGTLDLLVAIAGVVDPQVRNPRSLRVIHPMAQHSAVVAAVAEAWSVMSDWPLGFERLAAERLAKRTGRFGDGNGNATVRFLLLPSTAILPPDVAAIISALRQRLESNRITGIAPDAASARCGIRASELRWARRNGEIATIFHMDGARPVPLLDVRTIDALADREGVHFNKAAARLGCTYRAIEELAVLGLLRSLTPAPGRTDEHKIDARTLEELIARIRSAAGAPAHDAIPLRTAMRKLGGCLKPWAKAIEAMLAGDVAFHLKAEGGPLLDAIYIPPHEVSALGNLTDAFEGGSVRFSDKMSMGDAVEALNLHPRDGPKVFGHDSSSRGWERTIPVAIVTALARRYVAPSEVAYLLSIGPHAVPHVLPASGVERLSPAGYDREKFHQVFGQRLRSYAGKKSPSGGSSRASRPLDSFGSPDTVRHRSNRSATPSDTAPSPSRATQKRTR